jgi:hypothetical protein
MSLVSVTLLLSVIMLAPATVPSDAIAFGLVGLVSLERSG